MQFSKVAIISAPTREPSVGLRRHNDLLSVLEPTLRFGLRFQEALSQVSTIVLLQAYFVASHILFASKIVAVWSLLVSKFVLFKTALLSSRAAGWAWDSKSMKLFRKKLEYEFFTLILGCGNFVCIMVFWPGWIVVGLVGLLGWVCSG